MSAIVTMTRRRHELATALALAVVVAGLAPGLAQAEAEVDSGPSVAAFGVELEQLRTAAATGALPVALAESAEELWLEQQADLIRSAAELQILALRARTECPSVAEVTRLVVERERRAFERLARLRELAAGQAGSSAAAAAPDSPTEQVLGETRIMGLRITSEPEDLTEDPTP